jgi:hypothetical protein
MVTKFAALLGILVGPSLAFGSILPTDKGMSWSYSMTQEMGDGIRLAAASQAEDGSVRSSVLYRLDGTEDLEGTKVLKFEMHRDGLVTNTDLMTVDDGGIHCLARVGPDGERIPLHPAQTMVAAPLTDDLAWDFDGKAGTTDVHQHYVVAGQEDVTVPAGRFHAAFHIHGEQTQPDAMTIDRWFVPGTGIIKDITTMRNKDGDILQRIELQLKEKPRIAPRPEVKAQKFSAGLSSEAIGNFSTEFSTETPKIFARWQGHGLRNQARIRVVWIAEDVGDVAPANYTIDEASAVASIPEARGVFTLSRPDEGWAPGRYRVEFYVDDQLMETVKLKISAPDRFK